MSSYINWVVMGNFRALFRLLKNSLDSVTIPAYGEGRDKVVVVPRRPVAVDYAVPVHDDTLNSRRKF
jgi:hypothetical protein